MAYKEIYYAEQARIKLQKGVQKLAKAVSVTLGPKGRNCVIDGPLQNPLVTKDGITVAKSIELKDKDENIGVKIAREASLKTSVVAGDGTTTSIVLVNGIFNEGLKLVLKGANPVDLNKGMNIAKEKVIDYINNVKKNITTSLDIAQVATISSNGDREIGGLIADAMDKVGKDGVISINDSKTFRTYVEVSSGMQHDSGYLSPYFVTNPDTMRFEEENPYILIADRRFSNVKEIFNLINYVASQGRALVIIANKIEGEVMQTLVVNSIRKTLKCVAVESPSYGTKRSEILNDIAIATGGIVINDALLADLNLSEVGTKESSDATNLHKYDAKKYLGQAEKCVIDKDTFTIIGNIGSKENVAARVEQIKSQLLNTVGENEVEILKERIAKLISGIAIIKVGANTEVELKEKKMRVEDAVCSVKSAVSDGVVCGGGITLVRASEYLAKNKPKIFENKDQEKGYEIIQESILSPFKTIISNAGKNAQSFYKKIKNNSNPSYGYNVAKETFCDLIENAVIDPSLVTKTALENAVSAASMLLTTDCIIRAELNQKELEESIDAQLMGNGRM